MTRACATWGAQPDVRLNLTYSAEYNLRAGTDGGAGVSLCANPQEVIRFARRAVAVLHP
jgi:hypothetical protein